MNKIMAIFLGAVVVGALGGCAGTNFVRPDDVVLQNGKTTIIDVREKYGKPFRESNVTENDEDVTLLSYAYASTGGTPLGTGVIPARALELSFWKDRLVSNLFVSSFKDDASTFDDSKRAAIIKGRTTRDEVIGLLGRPAGYAIYPAIKDKRGQALLYSYQATRGSAFSLKFSKRSLVVTLDQNGVVSDLSYVSSGMQ